MVELKTLKDIKEAVDEGATVFCESMRYKVIKDKLGQYLITDGSYTVGLYGVSGKLNGTKFFINK